MVENGGGERRIVRVSNGDSSVDRAVGGLSNEWIVVAEAAPMGPLLILDPGTCEVLATVAKIPDYHTVLVIDPDDKIFLGEAGPGTLPDPHEVAPISADCPPPP